MATKVVVVPVAVQTAKLPSMVGVGRVFTVTGIDEVAVQLFTSVTVTT